MQRARGFSSVVSLSRWMRVSFSLIKGILKEYFSTFGLVTYFKVAKNKKSKEPQGFGFLEFKDDNNTNKVLEMKHYIQGREVVPRLTLDRC
jgi:RNA recognition motif-containing protein